MISENIKNLRKMTGLTQDELALKLNVVRQTVSKWERGISVPDSLMLKEISEVFNVSIEDLLGDQITQKTPNEISVISEKLEVINTYLSNRRLAKLKNIRFFLVLSLIIFSTMFIMLLKLNGSYLNWNYTDYNWAILGTLLHCFEWIFVRTYLIFVVLSLFAVWRINAKIKA